MKDTPQEARIRAKMKAGVITLNGFLGKDNRPLNEIIAQDENELNALGYTPEHLAERMQQLTDASFNSFEGMIIIDDVLEVETEVTRGKLPCPGMHSGMYRKTITTIRNTSNNASVKWTSLNIHLIREHHFFEGRGSGFRLEPAELVKALFGG